MEKVNQIVLGSISFKRTKATLSTHLSYLRCVISCLATQTLWILPH